MTRIPASNTMKTNISSFLNLFLSQNFVLWTILILLLNPYPASALEPEPHPLDTFLTDILNFQEPTGIRGTVRYIDKGEKIFG